MSEGAPLRAATVASIAAEQQAHAVEQLGVRSAAQLGSPADQVPEQELHWEEQGVERAEEEDQRSTFGNPNPTPNPTPKPIPSRNPAPNPNPHPNPNPDTNPNQAERKT